MLKLTYYLDVISSWCFYAEPMWADLKREYADVCSFEWQIALIGADGLPKTREEEEWYYRRSGTVVRRQSMLHSGWWEEKFADGYIAPNAVAEAAKDFGVTDDRVRLAIARAALERGEKVGRWDVAVASACENCPELKAADLATAAQSEATRQRLKNATAAFHALQVDQRPTFVLESEIGDRAVFSGLVHKAPLGATIEAMLHDVRAYRSFHAHFGHTPPGAEQ
jgi:predicted DsbA family dithiol-disulfide isomerase